MTMNKQSEQAMLTIGKGFWQGPFALYAGILVLIVFLLMNNSVSVAADAEVVDSSMSEEVMEVLPADDLGNQHVGMYSPGLVADWEQGLREKGLKEGANDRDIYIASGRQTVTFPITHPGFHESRTFAFDVAYLRAKAKMIRFLGTEIARSNSYDVLENARWSDGQGVSLAGLDQLSRIQEKVQDLAETELDQELANLDPTYDPEKYGDREQKEEAFREVVSRKIRTVATNFVSGALPFEVLEGPTGDGPSYEILVGLVWSPRLELAARAVAGSYAPPNKGIPGVSISEWLPKTQDAISASWGVHKLIDENGDQVFVGFGQAAPRRASPSRQARAEDIALRRAGVRAAGAIRGFVGETVRSEESDDGDEIAVEYADMAEGSEITNEFVDKIRSNADAKRFTGLTVVGRWVVSHPANGQKVAVVAVSWSPTGVERAGRVEETMRNPDRRPSRQGGSNDPDVAPAPRLLRRQNVQMEDF